MQDNTFDLKKVFLREDLEEMAYPDSWDWNTFKSLSSFAARIRYCTQHLNRIASGSSRIAFRIDEDKVLKLAKNVKGRLQNEAEYRLWIDPYMDQDFLARVFEYEEDGEWIEMELVTKAKPSDFKKEFGISIQDMDTFQRRLTQDFSSRTMVFSFTSKVYDKWHSGELEEDNEKLFEFLNSVQEMIGSYNYSIGDLGRISSYGVTKDGRIVIIDYGLTNEVFASHYSPQKKQGQHYGRY